nr:hypothetical protein BaRGS_022826 [Batillaria attramentaria]
MWPGWRHSEHRLRRQRVDLVDWTSYLELHPSQDVNNSVIVLLEAGRPDNLDTFVQAAVQVPLAQQVHGRLTLDEDLELYRLLKSPDDIAANDNLTQKIERPKVSKPPNVLVYCGIKDSARKFGNIKSCLEQCLNSDAYIIYHLAHEQVATIPWADNSAALIVSCDKLYADIERKFSDYLLSGGKVISFGSSLETKFLEREEVQKRHAITKFSFDKWKDVSSVHGCHRYKPGSLKRVDSKLGQRITFLQHIVGLAVVHSIRSLPGYQDLELRLKWPNDIYYRDQMKLGGVLVTSTIMGDRVHATVGCGVNVANSHPTICINDIIQHHNMETGSNLSRLSASQVVAMTVSALERLISQFQAEGSQTFCDLYYKYWLHGGVSVQLESEGEEVEICGLDGFGFLQVKTKKGKQLSVQPDGNSFDMMRNLIALKKQ